MHTSTRTLFWRRQDQLAGKSTHSLTKNSVPELNDQPTYVSSYSGTQITQSRVSKQCPNPIGRSFLRDLLLTVPDKWTTQQLEGSIGDFRITITQGRFLIIKPTRCTNFTNLFLEWNSTCFGQFLCPSSGVFHYTHSNGTCHTGLLTACEQTVSKPVLYIPLLCVKWKTPDDGQRNCPKHVEFHSKNKFVKLVHLVGFIIRKEEFLIYATRDHHRFLIWIRWTRSPCSNNSFLKIFGWVLRGATSSCYLRHVRPPVHQQGTILFPLDGTFRGILYWRLNALHIKTEVSFILLTATLVGQQYKTEVTVTF